MEEPDSSGAASGSQSGIGWCHGMGVDTRGILGAQY